MIDNKSKNQQQNEIVPIDFKTFMAGDKYNISWVQSHIRQEKYHYQKIKIFHNAIISDFRKGIAIASVYNGGDTFDCLINIKCEVLYMPSAYFGSRSEGCTIYREKGGKYIVKSYQDTAAPGKDSHWQGPFTDEVLDEYAGKRREEIIGYPMEIPYERGKLVNYGNTFYDLETYEPKFSYPDSPSFSIDSNFINGVCRIHDKKYFKKILVEVENGEIKSYLNITAFHSILLVSPIEVFSKAEDLLLETWVSNNLLSKVQSLLSKKERNLNIIPEFMTALKKAKGIHDYILNLYNLNWTWEWGGANSIRVHFYEYFYIIQNLNYYIYDLEGILQHQDPYKSLYPIKGVSYLKHKNSYLFETYNGLLEIWLETINHENKLFFSERLFNQILKEKEFRYNPGYNFHLLRNCGDKITIMDDNKLEDRYKRDYWDLNFNKLKKYITNAPLEYKTIISNYLYQTPDGQIQGKAYSDQSQLPSLIYPIHKIQYKKNKYKYIVPYKQLDNVIIPTEASIYSTFNDIEEEINKGSDYVTSIERCICQNNNTCKSIYYIFNYEPHGIMDDKGNITYKYGDPNIVIL